jgi:hypothetical protein
MKTAWIDVSSETMVEGFKGDINGTDDDVLWEDAH